MKRKRLNGKFIKSGKYKTCKYCNISFYVVASRISTKHFCSKICYNSFGRNNPIGEKSYNWKGGERTFSDGYVRIYNPTHPFANNAYILEHRHTMESYIGRYLLKGEIVHHINGIKNDNRIENLKLTTRKEHILYHRPDVIRWNGSKHL